MSTGFTPTREQILAFRLAGHSLNARRPASDLLKVAGACGVRNTPPGSAALALAARITGLPADALDQALLQTRSLVEVLSVRASPLLAPATDLAVFTVGALATDEASMRVALTNHTRELAEAGFEGLTALKVASEAAHDALKVGPLSRSDLSAAMTMMTPKPLSRYCDACKSTHVREMLFRTVGVAGVFVIVREGKETRYIRTDQWLQKQPAMDAEAARLELARRYLRCFGPSTAEAFAGWAGIGAAQGRATFAAFDTELATVGSGKEAAAILADDVARLKRSKLPEGVRLLPPYDAYLDQRDRDLLVPDKPQQKRLWRIIGNPGALLVDGEIAGIWRPQKKGKRLDISVEPFRALTKDTRAAVSNEAEALGPLRGCTSVKVTFAQEAS